MADLLGPSAGIEGALTDWGNYWGQVDQRARLRYDHREARDEREREHRYQLARARSNQGAYAGRAGLFENADARFNNMGPRNVPVAPEATPGLTPEQPAGSTTQSTNTNGTYLSDGVRALSLTSEEMGSLFTHRGGSQLGMRQYTAEEIQSNPRLRDILQRGQRYGQLQIDEVQNRSGETVYRVQRRTQGTVSAQNFAVPEPNTVLGVPLTWEDARNMRNPPPVPTLPLIPLSPEQARNGPAWGYNVQHNNQDIEARSRTTNTALPDGTVSRSEPAPNSPSATATIPPAYENTPTPQAPESNDPLFRGPNTQTYPGGLEPPDAEDVASRAAYQDTSGALTPTPEMQMLQTVVEDRLRLARLAAAHGRNTEAEQMFAQALQGQAAYLQQARLVQMRAASQGHQTALADLLGLYSGRPPGTTRLQQVGNTNQYNLQVLTPSGQWVNTPAGPFTYERLFQTARGLVDRESVMAETEANSEYIRASIAAGAQIRVAQINALSDEQDRYLRAAIAQLDNATEERIARGEGRLIVDSTNNRAYYEYNDAVTGEPIIVELGERDVRVADTNGRRTERQVTGRRITGITGVRGN